MCKQQSKRFTFSKFEGPSYKLSLLKNQPFYVILIALLISVTVTSQDHVTIVDASTNKPVAFSYIYCSGKIMYANENGYVEFPAEMDCDEIMITALGYEAMKLFISGLEKQVFLKPKPLKLDEVTLSDYQNSKIKKTKAVGKSVPLAGAILPCFTTSLSKVVPKPKLISKRISAVRLKTNRHVGYGRDRKVIYKNTRLKCRLEIYTNKNGSLGELIYYSKPQIVETGGKDELVFEIDKNIQFYEEGLFIQLTNLGALDQKGEFVDCEGGLFWLRMKIADKESKEYSLTSYQHTLTGTPSDRKVLNYSNHGMRENKDFYINYRFEYYD